MSQQQRTPPDVPGYELTRLIGLGGMGEVYLARQLVLNRPVAIKFLTRTASDPPDEYDLRFKREAELMARVSHPNVVTIFDSGTAAGRPYLVMEYIEDGDLRSRMVPDRPMKAGEIRSIVGPVIRAVDYLHRQGIVHRDLKPENILIHHEDTPKVTDFGIAVLDFAIGSMTRTGMALGTPGYVAPEQQYGLRVDERADQFSLAALCYEMATGRKPLGSYPPPSRVNPKLGREASDAILRGLKDEPEERFPTISEFGEALDRGLAASGRRAFPTRRAALIAGAAALVGGSVAALAPFAASLFAKTSRQPEPGPAPSAVVDPMPTALADDSRLVARAAGLALVKVRPGEFWMGTHQGDPAADKDGEDERPRHYVHVTRPFYLGRTEVTVAQFRKFVEARNYRTSAETPSKDGKNWGGGIFNLAEKHWEQRPDLNWKNPTGNRTPVDDEPVVQVSWYDATAFCDWLSEVEGRKFRLPTEAEWEYACRAGTTTRWSSGDDSESLDPFAWTIKNANYVPHPVATKKPNPFGLHDMHGNVWEWCFDYYGPYAQDEVRDPVGPPYDPSAEQGRVLRGGSYDWGSDCKTRSASRFHYSPYLSYCNYGFRVCSPEQP